MKKKVISTIIIVIVLIGLTLLYSRFIATTGLKIKEYKIVNENITESFNGLKIVHITDIHYGRTVKDKELKNIVKKINILKPDIVVLTGDLLDRDVKLTGKQITKLQNILNSINVKYNKYAIMGNHDYKHKEWESVITNSGFINLNNNYDLIYDNENNYMLLSGLSTSSYGTLSNEEKMLLSDEYINTINTDEAKQKSMYNILIMHEPDAITEINYDNYNLVLAGHSHNGQVRMPFIGAIILPPKAKLYYDEYYRLNNTDLYISSGLGTSNMDFRLFNRPSFNFYRIAKR